MNNRGQVLVSTLVFMTAMLVASLAVLKLVSYFQFNSARSLAREQALHLAEAGVDKAIWHLNNEGELYTGEENTSLGRGEFSVTLNTITYGIKEVSVTSYVPNAQNPLASRTVKIKADSGGTTISFRYAAQVGSDGLLMYSNSEIEGSVYSNGNVTGYSTSEINGDAYAVGTISSPAPWITGEKHPDSPIQDLPEFDAQYWKDAANKNNDPIIGDYQINSGSESLGPKKIQGNLTMNSNAELTLTGPLHVTGNFEMNSNTQVFIDPSFASFGTVIVVDGRIRLNSNAEIHHTGTDPKGYVLLASIKTGLAIELNSNATGGVFYSLSGETQLNSNAEVVAIAAKKLTLNSNAELDYEQGLAGSYFSSGPGGGWQITSASYQLK